MSTPIQVVHSDTTITYDEKADKWLFTLRGRDRSADSLAKAKEIIEKPVPAEKAKPFQKVPAWFFKYSNFPKKIEVTGIAEQSLGSLTYVWVNDGGKRSKEYVEGNIYLSNEKNDALITLILEKEKEAEAARKASCKMKGSLDKLSITKDE